MSTLAGCILSLMFCLPLHSEEQHADANAFVISILEGCEAHAS